jgi:hypothetical protein
MANGFPPPVPVLLPENGIITNPPNQNYSIIVPDMPVPYVENWNVAIQRTLRANLSLDLTYVGNHSVKISNSNVTNASVNINAATTAGTGAASEPLNIKFGRTASTTYPWFQSGFYDAFHVKLNRRFVGGFMMTTSYAFGKSIDYGAYNELGYKNYKGLSKYDRRHILTYSSTYDLPFGKGKRLATRGIGSALLGGWQLNGLWTWESGLPLNFSASSTSLNAPGNTQRPDVVAPVEILGNEGPGTYWFTTSSFANPPANRIGNVGRNILHGPRLFNINGSVFRRFNVTERARLEFRAEAYNVTNTPWFDLPNTTLGDPSFGQITTAQGNQSVKVNMNRSFQGSLRLVF